MGVAAVNIDRVASETEFLLWACPTCGASGALNIKGVDAYGVIEAVSDHHAALSKSLCTSGALPKLIRPQCWLETAHAIEGLGWKAYIRALRRIAGLSAETAEAHTAANTAIDIAREAILHDPAR